MADIGNRNQQWRIDRHIPVAIIFAIVLQTFGVIWWAAGIDSRVSVMEALNLDSRMQTIEKDIPAIREKINNIEKSTDRIEKKIDRLSLNWSPKKQTSSIPIVVLEEMTLAQLMEVRCFKA